MKMCGDEEDAKDVAQETLFAMAKGIRDFRGASSISTWLYTIARSFCIKKRRRKKGAPSAETSLDEVGRSPALVSPHRGPEDESAAKELERALNAAILELEPKYREVLILRDIEGLSAGEVSEVLNLSTDAVKSRLHRARLALRQRLAPVFNLPADAPAAPGTCPDVLGLFSESLEGDISAQKCAEMERHLEGCTRCRGVCDSLKRTLALCTTSRGSNVPLEVQDALRVAVRRALT